MEILLFDVYSLPERLFANKLPEVKIYVSVVGVPGFHKLNVYVSDKR